MSLLHVRTAGASLTKSGFLTSSEALPATGTPCWGVLAVVLACVPLTGGCGPSGPTTYPVSGTVTFNGEPLPDGYITFVPEDASVGPEGSAIENGEFSFRAREGKKKVKIEASRFVGPVNPVMGLTPKEQYIPDRYNVNSELAEEVTADGDNRFTFELTDEE